MALSSGLTAEQTDSVIRALWESALGFDVIPERCPVVIGPSQCVREFGHPGLHRDEGVPSDYKPNSEL